MSFSEVIQAWYVNHSQLYKVSVFQLSEMLEVRIPLSAYSFEQISVDGWQFAEEFKPHIPRTYL